MPRAARAAETDAASATEQVARGYFAAIAARDPDAMAACWETGAVNHLHGQADLVAPDEIRAWFGDLFAAFPDARMEIVDTTAEDDRCAVRWRLTGTFAGPGRFQGFEPTGARVTMTGCDVVQVRDGLVVGNDAYLDGMELGRQLGLLPPRDSGADRGMAALLNRRTRLQRRLAAAAPEQIAEGVWVLRGGLPRRTMNVYLVRDGDGVLAFDAGIASMAPAIAAAAAHLGGLTRIVLGHAHADHRGAAAALARAGVPVLCHPAERADAEGDGGAHYMDLSKLALRGRLLFPLLLPAWDGGPVEIAGTVEEGDDVAGLRVVHLPGHAPGMVGLWRESDRLLLASDCVYTLDPQSGLGYGARVPHPAFGQDDAATRASVDKAAALEPATLWAGHGRPLTGDVGATLRGLLADG